MFFEGGVQVLLQLLEDLLMLAVHPWATPSRALHVRQGAYLVFLQIQRDRSHIDVERFSHPLMVLLLQRRCDNPFSKINAVSACPDPLLHPLMMSNALEHLFQVRSTRSKMSPLFDKCSQVFYSQQRRHSSPCHRSPVAFEEQTTHPELRLL
ncbi:hypothetical protein SAMN00790413_05224 [Deinococcus hopiensis KR-140]|uniref:Uncharacterized protein n=1 Tax=Deinococcus hopiensis KR-140 TaxID=695939 RepID=A0A1W1UVA6_9DEIO|nr:hypothetical protein SAMN00790413_05224 [Deinococcus hopiensis KR-140]